MDENVAKDDEIDQRFTVFLSSIKSKSIKFYEKIALIFQPLAKVLPTHQSTGILTFGFIIISVVVAITSNTRAVISPFYQLGPLWIFFGIVSYCIGFTFSKSLTMSTRYLRPFTIVYFFITMFFALMFISPNSNLFLEPFIRNTSGAVSLLFITLYGGVLCGDVAQSDALGDVFFSTQILPKIQSYEVPISLLHCDLSGEFHLIESKSWPIKWNENAKQLELKGVPLNQYTPVLMRNRHLMCARDVCLDMINNQPRTRREAMRHYLSAFNEGYERFRAIYLVYHLGMNDPSSLAKPGQFIRLLYSKIEIDGTKGITIEWDVPKTRWKSLDDRPLFNQIVDPSDQFPSQRQKILDKEKQLLEKIMPEFYNNNEEQGLNFHRSFLNFLLAHRLGEFQSEVRMRIMQSVSQWVIDHRKAASPRISKGSKFRTVSIDEWNRISDLLETEGVSLFMRMYNWLNDLIESYSNESELCSKVEQLIEDGLSFIRSKVEQSGPSGSIGATSFGIHRAGQSANEKKIRLHVTTINWILFASTVATFEELPV